MRLAAALTIALTLGVLVVFALDGAAQAATRCRSGAAQGFAAIRFDPNVAPSIPESFSGDARFFWRRYNCTRRGVLVRRVGQGVYDIAFPGLGRRLAVVSATSDAGVSASVRPFGTGVFRVALRGPLVGDDVAERRDVPFSIVVY